MNIETVDELTEAQTRDLHRMYQREWWTGGRGQEDIQRMLAHSDVVLGLCDANDGRLVAFARVLTDRVYKGLILDVIVEATHRKRGLGHALMDALVEHPTLKKVEHLELYCLPELVPFYRRWGFTEELEGLRFMRRPKGS